MLHVVQPARAGARLEPPYPAVRTDKENPLFFGNRFSSSVFICKSGPTNLAAPRTARLASHRPQDYQKTPCSQKISLVEIRWW